MKIALLPSPSQNIVDARGALPVRIPPTNPFSYALSRDTVDPRKGYNGPSTPVNIPNNPFQAQIDAIQKMGDVGHAKLMKMISKDIGQLNRTDENGYNIRSRAPTGALRPNTRSN